MRRNILLTTLGNTFDHTRHNYYSYNENGRMLFCEGISMAEAGAKYILSKRQIDKIIVLGPSAARNESDIADEVRLRDLDIFGAEMPEEYSEYKFFCYRIMQFFNRIDIEGNDLLEELTDEERKETLEALERHYPKEKWKELFSSFNADYDAYEELLDLLPHMDKRHRKWIKHYLFMRLDRSIKMSTHSVNDDITVQFCPTTQLTEKHIRMDNLPNILNYILEDGKAEVEIYIDLQGMDIADSHTLINVLFILQNEKRKKMNIEEIITTTYRPALFTNPIEDQKNRLELSDLLSSMDAFLRYGKVDGIRDYWMSRNIRDEHIERLIYAMQKVDVGISLCSVSDLEKGISMLKTCFWDNTKSPEAIESMIFYILKTGIRNDYGKLLRGTELNTLALIKWAMRKHFYQQALTIIESKVPEDLVQSQVFYYARNEEEKQMFLRRMSEVYWLTLAKDRYQFDNLSHYFVKFYRRREAYQLRTENPLETYVDMRLDEIYDDRSEIKAYTMFNGKRPVFKEFLLAYLRIGNIRNHISHAQEVDIEDENWDLNVQNEKIRILENSISEFMLLYEKVRTGIKKNPHNDFMITQEEFYEYRNSGDFSLENRQAYMKKVRSRKKTPSPGS